MAKKPIPVTTNAVKFDKFAIVLEKERLSHQLSYYSKGELTRVADVGIEFSNKDLFDLAVRISEKNGYGPVEFTSKNSIIKNRK